MLETAPLFSRRRAEAAAASSQDQAIAQRPALVRWGAHAAFWGVYLLARTAAAEANDMMPSSPEWASFPFFLNRALVVASYAVVTGALLVGVQFLRKPEHKRYANLAIVFGAFLVMPVGQFVEEFWPSLLAGEPRNVYPLISYMFQMGWALPLWGASQALIGYHLEVVEQARAVVRARTLAYDAQLRALHYQINPHFLFNTLNAISTLVLESRGPQAERMLMRLSAFLRYSLDRNPNDLAPLSEEIDAQRQYLGIEQTRFGDRLVIDFDIDPAILKARVPSLILQPILENAIKHAVTPQLNGGHIIVSARRDGDVLRIKVEDDGPGIEAGPPSRRGLGLANTRERLALLYEDRGGLVVSNRKSGGASGCAVELFLPYEE